MASERVDIRTPFIHLKADNDDVIYFLPSKDAEAGKNMWQPLFDDVYLNVQHVSRIDSFTDGTNHFYLDNGDFFRVTNGFTTKCL